MNEVKIPKSPSPSPSPSQFWKISDRPRNLISASKGREIERGRERGKKERSYVASAGVTGICKLGSAADLATQSEVYKDEGDGGNEGDERQRLRQGQTDRQTDRLRGFFPGEERERLVSCGRKGGEQLSRLIIGPYVSFMEWDKTKKPRSAW